MFVVASALALCGAGGLSCGGGSPGGGNRDGGGGAAAAPLPGAPGSWTWVDVPGMGCDDGSATGVAVNPAPGSGAGSGGALFIYFMGGGACWDASTCFVLNTAAPPDRANIRRPILPRRRFVQAAGCDSQEDRDGQEHDRCRSME